MTNRTTSPPVYKVELGRDRGRYKVVCTCSTRAQADMVYMGYNVGNGWNKRLRRDGVTIARLRTERFA